MLFANLFATLLSATITVCTTDIFIRHNFILRSDIKQITISEALLLFSLCWTGKGDILNLKITWFYMIHSLQLILLCTYTFTMYNKHNVDCIFPSGSPFGPKFFLYCFFNLLDWLIVGLSVSFVYPIILQ